MPSTTTAPTITKAPSATTSPDTQAYEKLVLQALPALLKNAKRLTWPDLDLASDLVQNAVIKGLRALRAETLELSPKTSAWLKQAVYLEFLMYRRGMKPEVATSLDLLDINPSDAPTPFQDYCSPEILAALHDLPQEQRVLVLLVDFDQMEYQEVCDLLQIPIGTVRSRLSRARWKLANQLQHLAGDQK